VYSKDVSTKISIINLNMTVFRVNIHTTSKAVRKSLEASVFCRDILNPERINRLAVPPLPTPLPCA